MADNESTAQEIGPYQSTIEHYNSSLSGYHPSAYDSDGNDLMVNRSAKGDSEMKDHARYGTIDVKNPQSYGRNQATYDARIRP